ncbi:MAG: hypothetical protein HRU21_09800 [Pseudomonadales bacterium]|nr:hypothetical protein [Pseudomonadales bacterium]
MKKGANVSDQKKIKDYTERGMSIEEISNVLLIDVAVIKEFLPEKQAKAKKAAAKKKAENEKEHKEIMDAKKGK